MSFSGFANRTFVDVAEERDVFGGNRLQVTTTASTTANHRNSQLVVTGRCSGRAPNVQAGSSSKPLLQQQTTTGTSFTGHREISFRGTRQSFIRRSVKEPGFCTIRHAGGSGRHKRRLESIRMAGHVAEFANPLHSQGLSEIGMDLNQSPRDDDVRKAATDAGG
jgi:hypothetical protein